MSTSWVRAVSAGVSALLAAVSGIVTNLATDSGAAGWWTALGVLVVTSVGAQVWVGLQPSGPGPAGSGSVRVGRDNRGRIVTGGSTGSTAPGAGAVDIGRDNDGDISTGSSSGV